MNSRNRWARALAAFGLLTSAAGVAVLATAPTATAADEPHKNYICKFITKPGPDEVDQGGGSPIFNDWNASEDADGDGIVERGDWFKDGQGLSIVIVPLTPKLDPEPTQDDCWALYNEVFAASATLTPVEPSCANGNIGSWTASATNATLSATNGTAAPGETVNVTATVVEPFFFPGVDSNELVLSHTFGAAEECPETREATPVEPSYTEPDCDTAAGLALPTTEGVQYDVAGTVAAGETVTITASALEGFVLVGQSVFEHTFGDAPAEEDCTFVEPPVVEPPVVEPPVVDPPNTDPKTPAVVTPTVVRAGLADDISAASASADETLRLVGTGLTGAGLVLLLGSGALWLRRDGGEA